MNKNMKSGNILVVDDSPLVPDLLAKESYAIRVIQSDKAVLPALHVKIPDLILVNGNIPGLNPMDICAIVKKEESARNVPIILLGGQLTLEEKRAGFVLGISGYIEKPFQPDELLSRIRTHVKLSRSQAQLKIQAAELLLYGEKLDTELGTHGQLVAEREEAFQELLASEAKYRSLFEKSRDALMILEPPSWKFTSGNQAALNMFGAENCHQLVSGSLDLFSPARQPDGQVSLEKSMKMIELALKSSSHYFDWILQRFDGRVFPATVLLTCIEISGKKCLQVTIKDVSELKRAELERETALQTLKKRDEQYRTLIDNAGETILVVQDGMIKFGNHSTLALTGYSVAELRAKPYLDLIYPEDRVQIMEIEKNKVDGDPATSQYQTRLLSATGEIKWAEVNPVKIKWENRIASLNFITDISKRKSAEEALWKEHSGLEKTVEMRTTELRESLRELTSVNLRLEETGRYKSRFLSSMNHELRTPLNSIIGFAELLNNVKFGTLNEKQSKYASLIESNGKLLLMLITDLLDLSRIDAGNMVLDLSICNPWEFIGTISEMMGTQFRKKEMQIQIDISPDIRYVYADLKKCKQIMVILLSNALKYTPAKGKISIRAFNETEKMLRVEVRDTGVGIAKEHCEKLFMDFFQIDRQHDEQLSGTGIGLALVRRLVELQAGKVGVESKLGKGSTFWFTLPVQSSLEEDKNLSNSLKNETEPILGRKILVAEDDEHNLILLTEILSLWDHTIMVARNGQEAIDLYLSGSPDLIIMDLRMPVKSGMEATGAIREIERNRREVDGVQISHVPIVALTASVRSDTKQFILKAGFDMFLPKPAGIADIKDMLKIFLK